MLVSDSLTINTSGHLEIGGADVTEVAKEYGTPLYIMDEEKIRRSCREYVEAFEKCYGKNFMVCYASKAFSAKYIYKIINEEKLGTDVVSGGELYTALQAGFPPERICFHGNNKTAAEIDFALEHKIREFIVDNLDELCLIDELAKKHNTCADVAIRIKPGIDAHTHSFIKTGQIDSKFGVALENGEAFEAAKKASEMKNINLCGVHCHIGSQIFETEPFELAARVMIKFMSDISLKLGIKLSRLCLGGGFGVKYIESDNPKSTFETIKTLTDAVKDECRKRDYPLPFLSIEPGRSIVASSGITVYTVGNVKEIKDVRTYVSTDGGMTDNPRYMLYGAEYTALLPERADAAADTTVTIAGRNCESGDIIGVDMKLPKVKKGDLLAVLVTGAYNYTMASNYNRVPRPPVVMIKDKKPKLIVRRETYEDVASLDLI